MKPPKVTPEGERVALQRHACDQLISMTCGVMMDREIGADLAMVIDRLFIAAAIRGCSVNGSARTAAALRVLAEAVEGGMYGPSTGDEPAPRKAH